MVIDAGLPRNQTSSAIHGFFGQDGRSPSSAEQLGLKLIECLHGFAVDTDEEKQTSIRGVYAAGDTARLHHNATLASADGVVAGIFGASVPDHMTERAAADAVDQHQRPDGKWGS